VRRRRNPSTADVPTTAELVVGGGASLALVGLGVVLIYQALNEGTSTETTLSDTSSLTALATLAPLA
jgi:hypothetical protein